LALILGESRSASIVALRDSIVARLSRHSFNELVEHSPQLALGIAKGAIERFRKAERLRNHPASPVNLCFLAITPNIDLLDLAKKFLTERERYGGPVQLLTSRSAGDFLGKAAPEESDLPALVAWLTRLESSSEALCLMADETATPWTRLCTREADEILLVADANQPPGFSPVEQALFDGDSAVPTVRRTLLLLHPMKKECPRGTASWLEARCVHRHFHLRRGHTPDLQRIARVLSGRAVGLVLAGGGARAFVHFGVINALAEAGIAPDFIGGTSMGATAAAWRAMDLTGPEYVAAGRKVYLNKPTSDLNPLPLMSIIRGKRVRRITEQAVNDSSGHDANIEDLWLPFFCIATNLSASEQAVLQRGSLTKSLLASFSIPGALPPILLDGQLMVDGGTFNNFPVDVMESLGVGKIIGVVVAEEKSSTMPITELPGTLDLLVDCFRRPEKRQYRLPLLPEILLTATISSSVDRQRQAINQVDLLFEPAVQRISPLDWEKYDEIIAEAHDLTRQELEAMPPEFLDGFR
jgi:NTE family protein